MSGWKENPPSGRRRWLLNPSIYQSYAATNGGYCFKFSATHCRVRAHQEPSYIGGYEVLSSLSSAGCRTSRGKTSGQGRVFPGLAKKRDDSSLRDEFPRLDLDLLPRLPRITFLTT